MTGSLSMILVSLTGVSVALPRMRDDLHLSTAGVQWVVTAYALALGSLVAVSGRLGDRFGRRSMFVLGVLVFAVAAGVVGLAGDAATAVAARAVQGAGAAMMQPAATSTVISTFGEGERGRAMAIYAGVSSAFIAIGPVLGGALTQFVSWRAVFLMNLPIAVASLVLTVIVKPPTNPIGIAASTSPGRCCSRSGWRRWSRASSRETCGAGPRWAPSYRCSWESPRCSCW